MIRVHPVYNRPSKTIFNCLSQFGFVASYNYNYKWTKVVESSRVSVGTYLAIRSFHTHSSNVHCHSAPQPEANGEVKSDMEMNISRWSQSQNSGQQTRPSRLSIINHLARPTLANTFIQSVRLQLVWGYCYSPWSENVKTRKTCETLLNLYQSVLQTALGNKSRPTCKCAGIVVKKKPSASDFLYFTQ